MALRKFLVAIVAPLVAALYMPLASPVQAANSVPALDHVFLIVMENTSYGSIVGNSAAPYINGLLPSAGLATNYFAVSHPSLPNYLSLSGASTFGITSDCTTCWISASNVADNVEAAGKTWKAYEESDPSACFVGDSYPYAQKHDPFIYYNDIRTNTSRCQSHVLPYTQMATDLLSTSTTPNYAFITPNMCNDMHDCSIQTGDSWLQQNVPSILSSPAFTTQKSLLVITWDEDDSTGSNQVATLFLGPNVAHAGFTSSASYNHYSLLHTIEAGLGLATLNSNDAGAATMSDMFAAAAPPAKPVVTAVSPATGSTAGGTWVTVSGTGLSGATSVSFGGTPASSVTPVSGTQLTAVSPSHGVGTVDITVTTGGGTSATTVADQFTYSSQQVLTACSMSQYSLTGSDGQTWKAIDSGKVSLNFTPSQASTAILDGNADLWTSSAGYNQDLGIAVTGQNFPSQQGQPEAWKESGGFAGTYSPNAAFVQSVIQVAAGQTYSAQLVWKAGKPDTGTIWAAAGHAGAYSTTCINVRIVSAQTAVIRTQPSLSSSDGTTWQPLDPSLQTTVSPSSNGIEVLSANADLWTANAGFNQDIAVFVSVDGGADQLVGWKESGGFAGTFSPNAADVQATWPMNAGSTYVFKLKWKTNQPAPGATIYAGAGPIGGNYSPTRLTALFEPSIGSVVSTKQFNLSGSDGSTWKQMDSSLQTTFTPTATGNYALSANADLWTANAGLNQDIAIFISGGAYTSPTLVAWKESGGFAGTYSPNAAYAENEVNLQASTTYTIWIAWKTNKSAVGDTILAAAGPLAGTSNYSPTRLTITSA